MRIISKTLAFLKRDVWQVRLSETSKARAFFIRALRVMLLVIERLSRGRTYLHASGLTFYTLLSIVPVLAMLFGVAQGFGLSRVLERLLLERIQGQEEALSRIIEFSHKLLETTQGGVLAGVGVAVLFWSIIKVFGNIEASFNEVWGVSAGRSFVRKITEYPALFFLCPALLVLSSALTVMVTAEVAFVVEKIRLLERFGPVIFRSLELLPMLVLWLLFTLIYVVMPNTRVRLVSAAVAGVIAGTAYLLFQQIYISFQIGVAKYNAIYGSFAALPLFLAWLQTSWMIVMVGAEISWAHQNVDLHESGADVSMASPHMRKVLALLVMSFLVKRFSRGDAPPGERHIAEELKIPVVFVQDALRELTAAGIVSQVLTGGKAQAVYQPCADSSVITVDYVLRALEHSGSEDLPLVQEASIGRVARLLRGMEERMRTVPENVLLRDF